MIDKKEIKPGVQVGWYSDQGNLVAEFEVLEVLDGKVARLKVLRSRRPELAGRVENYTVRDMTEWAERIRPGVGVFA
ncbi:hypothetical protein [Pseudomonas syringae]|nr:hypothetical protein [Pseudomonas syringae]PYD15827.1 hypothetical protein DND62_06700 [Pseudomonas syringae pv. pisi]PYD34339.1 hypothetical protein DND58_01655 [Pseudomonas syringae pv. pisi]RML58357.1 hypothetical protein ALQ93_00358 [Pseudomonas syringae pv. pisi]RMM20713.1 hypothetical protein ALQ82_02444 [Pseudomonas syringae pv. pisi]